MNNDILRDYLNNLPKYYHLKSDTSYDTKVGKTIQEIKEQIQKDIHNTIQGVAQIPSHNSDTFVSTLNDQIEASIEEILALKYKPEQLMTAFLLSIERKVPSDLGIEKLISLISQHTSTTKKTRLVDFNDSGNEKTLDYLITMVNQIPHVKDAMVLYEGESSATITIRQDFSRMNEEEVESSILALQNVIDEYRPQYLDALEIIFHQREVY